MICPKDNNHDVVENEVMGKKFFYCRGCKDEVTAQPEPKKDDYPWWTGMTSTIYTTGTPQYPIKLYGSFKFDPADNYVGKPLDFGCGDDDCDLCNPKGAA